MLRHLLRMIGCALILLFVIVVYCLWVLSLVH